MTTKKQKRAIAMAKHQAFMEEVRRTGLEAQEKDRRNRAISVMKRWEKSHEKHSKRDILVEECPICDPSLVEKGAGA